MKKATIILMILTLALWVVPASAVTVQTFTLSSGATAGGLPVSGFAKFTIDNVLDTITVDIWNTQANPKSDIQTISDLFFMLNVGDSTGALSSSSGIPRTVASDKTYSDGSAITTGWTLRNNPDGNASTIDFKLDGLGTGTTGPKHTIIGPPAGDNKYDDANPSIRGSAPHNPFLFGTETTPVEFVLSIGGLTAETRVSNVVFSFGTASGTNVPAAPVPPSLLLLGSGLLGLAGIRFCKTE